MIVDDSAVVRAVLARMLAAHEGFQVVGSAGSAPEALGLLGQLDVDIILLDLEMPGIGGLAALPDLLAAGHGAKVLIVSSACAEGAAATVSALRLGAADTLVKPGAVGFAGHFAEELVERMARIAHPRTHVAPHHEPTHSFTPAPVVPIACIGIGASTGGVHALATFFHALPASVTAPILITQHLPAPFMPYFVPQLAEMASRPVRLAAAGLRPTEGEIMLAPGDGSLSLARFGGEVHIRLDRRRSASGFLPSVDPMMATIGECYGPAAVGVMLSGMGRDGATGAETLVAAGGTLWAQDAQTSVVWGMPGAVANAGLAQDVLPPEAIASAIAYRSGGGGAWR
ncbi:response regulator [Sphingomonas nostoxanthinifaciens]|nr:response regulator [Sphingomonas nostoxanthinifaciens]